MSLIKRGKRYYLNNYKIFEGAYGTVQNFFMRCQQGLVKLCKIYRGCLQKWPKAGKEGPGWIHEQVWRNGGRKILLIKILS